MCIYRNEQLIFPQENERIELDDEVIIITQQKNLEAFHEQLDLTGKDKQGDSSE